MKKNQWKKVWKFKSTLKSNGSQMLQEKLLLKIRGTLKIYLFQYCLEFKIHFKKNYSRRPAFLSPSRNLETFTCFFSFVLLVFWQILLGNLHTFFFLFGCS